MKKDNNNVLKPEIIHLLANLLNGYSSSRLIDIFNLHLPDDLKKSNKTIKIILESTSWQSPKRIPIQIFNILKDYPNGYDIIQGIILGVIFSSPSQRMSQEEFESIKKELVNSLQDNIKLVDFNDRNEKEKLLTTFSRADSLKPIERSKFIISTLKKLITEIKITQIKNDAGNYIQIFLENPKNKSLEKIINSIKIEYEKKPQEELEILTSELLKLINLWEETKPSIWKKIGEWLIKTIIETLLNRVINPQ